MKTRYVIAIVGVVLIVLGGILFEIWLNFNLDGNNIKLADIVTAYGFNTHMYASEASNLDLDTFKENVDDIASKGLTWIRFPLLDWEVAPSGPKINWNYTNLLKYDEAINYTKEKGLKVFLVTNVPKWAKNYSLEDYKKVTKEYYGFLAKRYKGKVDVWQIFNEPNVHHYTDYSPVILEDNYLSDLNEVILVAKETIKSIDPFALITMNVGGWPHDERLRKQWKQFFDALAQNLDILTLDIYPDDNTEIINQLAGRVNEIKNRYSKPVFIGETGMCTGGQFTESDQGYYVPNYIKELKKASPRAVIIYEIQDDSAKSGYEATFGLKTFEGRPKKSYYPILNEILGLINIDGDFHLSEEEDRYYWNPHSFGLPKSAEYGFQFSDYGEMWLKETEGDAGHVAMGVWWDKHFPNGERFSLDNKDIYVDFEIMVVYAEANKWNDKEFLRIALVSAFQDTQGKVWYTELDIWDSPETDWHPDPSIIWSGGNVKEYKVDQIPIGIWKHYHLNLSEWIRKAWPDKSIGGWLESVYVVIELARSSARIRIDNFWVKLLTS